MTTAASARWDLTARVPDWVVLGRIRDRIRAGEAVPAKLCEPDGIAAYVPALLDAGHTPSEIERCTGVNASRLPRSTR